MSEPYDVLQECRDALGLTDEFFDNQISRTILAARIKMQLGGVSAAKATDDSDPLIIQAIICYVKGMVGNDNPDAERYLESFESIVTQMKNIDAYSKEES